MSIPVFRYQLTANGITDAPTIQAISTALRAIPGVLRVEGQGALPVADPDHAWVKFLATIRPPDALRMLDANPAAFYGCTIAQVAS